MTTPATGPISLLDLQNEFGGTTPISFNEYYAGGLYVPASISGLPSTGAIDLNNFHNRNNIISGNSGVLTSVTTYTLPVTTGTTIKVLAIGGGGGGGGGTARTQNTGNYCGGGGGGAGEIRYATFTATLGSSVSFTIGGAGGVGSTREGGYSGGASGSAGGSTSVYYNGSLIVSAGGGQGGTVSQVNTAAPGGAAGSSGTGTLAFTPEAGQSVTYSANEGGGYGGSGYALNTTVNQTPYTLGTRGTGGLGSDRTPTAGNFKYSVVQGTTGTVYGAGGGGGGKNNEHYSYPEYVNGSPASGQTGAVFIWWNY